MRQPFQDVSYSPFSLVYKTLPFCTGQHRPCEGWECVQLFILKKTSSCFELTKKPINRFEEHEAPGSRSFFTEIIASISDIKFSRDGRYILSRDYMTLKVCY